MSRGDVLRRSETALSDLFFQDAAGSWIHVMDLETYVSACSRPSQHLLTEQM
jgi:hypothetical protein